MFNPNAKLINCNTCGEITEEEIKNGKKIKNCKRCREANNENRIKEQQAIKCEKQPAEGFCRSETHLYKDNVKEEQETSTTTTEEKNRGTSRRNRNTTKRKTIK